MDTSFIKNIRVLKRAIAERKLVVFAGSGVSFDSGVPTWSGLITALRSEIDIDENENDFLRVAQMYYNDRQQKDYIDKIREALKYKKLRFNEIHEAIFDLNPEHIITTNFDDLFEQVIKSKAYPFSVIKKDSEFPYGKNTNLLVKIHGDLDEANLVFKEDDYLEYANNHPLIESFIKGIFSNKVVLFIGYSFSDINLKTILHSVRNILGKDFQSAYMLSIEENFHDSKRQYLKNKGINVINYNDAGILFEMNAIEQYLYYGRNALNHNFGKQNLTLSAKGSKLLNLIRFITKYCEFAESVIKEDPLTQMYKSLDRFNELLVIPPTFLANLFPFNNRKRRIYNYSLGTLGSNNNKITEFFFEELDNQSNTLNDTYFTKHSISLERKIELEHNLNKITEKLAFSSVFYFGRSKQRLELFDYPNELNEKIEISSPYKNCECLSCLFNSLRINDFLKKLKESSISETSEIQNDLLIAYSNYKAGNFKTSYLQFEEIANKSWQLGKYISYFISKVNIKRLRNLINLESEEISQENKKIIVEKIEGLDLDKLMVGIPNLDEDIYKLLKIIKDDSILNEINDKLDEYHEKIKSIYELYKNGGFSNGPYYPALIEQELYKLFSFYTYNYIVKDEYHSYKKVFAKGINSFLICCAIDEKYPQKPRELNFWALQFIILYGNDTEILNTMTKYNINKINTNEENFIKVIQYLNNLFKSVYTEHTALSKNIYPDKDVSAQSNINYFQERIRHTTHIAFLIFACIEIREEYASVLISNFLNFLRSQNFLSTISSKYLNSFLRNIKDHFEYKHFKQLIEIILQGSPSYVDKDFYRIVTLGISSKNP